MASVVVLGMDRLLARLAAIPIRALSAADSSLHETADAIKTQCKDSAPVESGDLEEGFVVHAVPVAPMHAGYVVESEAPHTIHVEYGTSEQPAQPMMRPAFDSNARPGVERAKSAIRGAIQ